MRKEPIEVRQIQGVWFSDGVEFATFALAYRYAKLLAGWLREIPA